MHFKAQRHIRCLLLDIFAFCYNSTKYLSFHLPTQIILRTLCAIWRKQLFYSFKQVLQVEPSLLRTQIIYPAPLMMKILLKKADNDPVSCEGSSFVSYFLYSKTLAIIDFRARGKRIFKTQNMSSDLQKQDEDHNWRMCGIHIKTGNFIRQKRNN